MGIGSAIELQLIGDFADQTGVLLPANFLSWSTTNALSATVDGFGFVRGIGNGSGAIVAQRGGVTAATAFQSGVPQADDMNVFLMGLDAYPDSVSVAENGGTRQIKLFINNQDVLEDIGSAAEGTRYFSSNNSIVQVSADGLITGYEEGEAIITVINKMREVKVLVKVITPVIGAGTVGQEGGIVRSADGLQLAVAPGAFDGDTAVEIERLQVTDLDIPPLPASEGWDVAGVFRISAADDRMNVSAQIELPTTLGAGTEVWFYRRYDFPNPDGTVSSGWLQVESGIVGADGVARTASPPHDGITQAGDYVAYSMNSSWRGKLVNMVLAAIGGVDSTSIMGVSTAGGVSYGTFFDNAVGFMMAIVGSEPVKLRQITSQGPTIEIGSVAVTAGAAKVETFVNVIRNHPRQMPRVSGASITFAANGDPILTIQGYDFQLQSSGGPGSVSSVEGIEVVFDYGDVTYRVPASSITGTIDGLQTVVLNNIPRHIVVGLANIKIARKTTVNEVVNPGSPPEEVEHTFMGTGIEMRPTKSYAFTASGGFHTRINVIDTQTNDVIARMQVGVLDKGARDIVLTVDSTRAYVSQHLANRIAVIDTMALRELDALPDDPEDPATQGLNQILLPTDARPGELAISPDNKWLYATDMEADVLYAISIDPNSPDYHKVKVIKLGFNVLGHDARWGASGIAVAGDGTEIILTVPGSRPSFTTRPGNLSVGTILVVKLESQSSKEWLSKPVKSMQSVGVGLDPYAVAATPDPSVFLISNHQRDGDGIGKLTRAENGTWSYVRSYVQVDIVGENSDSFDVNNAAGMVVTSDGKYAFFASTNTLIPFAMSHDPSMSAMHPAGGSIGIIQDPFGPNRKLVGALRMIPESFPDEVALSPDGKTLYGAFFFRGAVFGYDVDKIRALIETGDQEDFIEKALNDIDPTIDIKADYSPLGYTRNGSVVFGSQDSDPANDPIGTQGAVRKIAVQDNLLRLLTPSFNGEFNEDSRTFTYTVNGRKVEARFFISTQEPGKGLFPSDTTAEMRRELSDIMDPSGDANAKRIYYTDWKSTTDAQIQSFKLPDAFNLTAGQTYWWGVEVRDENGRFHREGQAFKTAVVSTEATDRFASVTVLTHGFQPISDTDRNTLSGQKSAVVESMGRTLDIALAMAKSSKALIFVQNSTTGDWIPFDRFDLDDVQPTDIASMRVDDPANAGKSIILVPNWALEAGIADSGFAEAAADAVFASMVGLNNQSNGNLFRSPIQMIGFSRGASVNSEIVQRLGTHFAGAIEDLRMTTLDPHDFVQEALDIPVGTIVSYLAAGGTIGGLLMASPTLVFAGQVLGHASNFLSVVGWTRSVTRNFYDPDVRTWANLDFHDNYFQSLGVTDEFSFTPNGRSLLFSDIHVQLNGRTGFVHDETLLGGDFGLCRRALARAGLVRRYRRFVPRIRAWWNHQSSEDLALAVRQSL